MRAQDRTEMKPYELKKLGPKPDARPENCAALLMVDKAWHELDGDRRDGMDGPGAIPYTAIVTWAEVNRLDRETFEVLREVIRRQDNERAIKLGSARKTKGKKR